ncbi:MAG TPA: lamin tail domain-containing protein [Pyrinomonadaceae bacterium]|jgi:hypothetical protein
MRKLFLPLAAAVVACLPAAAASGAANYVRHEQTGNYVAAPTCPSAGTNAACGRYVENTDRGAAPGYQIYSPESYDLHFKVEYRLLTNQARVFYTTDGSTPTADDNCTGTPAVCNPTPAGTTQAAVAGYNCFYPDQSQACQNVDVLAASIPPQPAGATVRYILAAWLSTGGEVVYANSGGASCALCSHCTSGTSGCASVFQYEVAAVPTPPLVISEFRLRGPGTGAPGSGANDEFVEIYNDSDAEITVQTYDGSAGFALAAADGVPRFIIPNGTRIPARAHYLGVNSVGYSLGSYPASTTAAAAGGGGDEPAAAAEQASDVARAVGRSKKKNVRAPALRAPKQPRAAAPNNDTAPGPSATASGDAVYTTDIADNVGIALFNTSNPANFSEATRLDAVGSTSEANTLFKEGAGYPALGGAAYFSGVDYSFFRDECGKTGSVTTFGVCQRSTPQDTNDNGTDFLFVDTGGTSGLGAGPRLGAPGPQNSTSPRQRTSLFPGSDIFPCKSRAESPNRERVIGNDPANNATLGTMSIRIRVTNSTGANVTRLRFRVIDMTTHPVPPGFADLRARTSSTVVITDPCTGLPATVFGTTLETPPAQPSSGGFNSTLSAGTVTLATPIPAADNPLTPAVVENAYDFQLSFGIQRGGRFKVYVNVEALP